MGVIKKFNVKTCNIYVSSNYTYLAMVRNTEDQIGVEFFQICSPQRNNIALSIDQYNLVSETDLEGFRTHTLNLIQQEFQV